MKLDREHLERYTKIEMNGVFRDVKIFTYAKNNDRHITTLGEIKSLRAVNNRYVLRFEDNYVNAYIIHLLFLFYDYVLH